MTLYLTRAILNKTAGNEALASLLDPKDEGEALRAHHAVVWTLFPGDADKMRDFLWRADGGGRFYILSPDEPQDHPLFHPLETKSFEPALKQGDRLSFIMRVNATKDLKSKIPRIKEDGKKKRVTTDIVMAALKSVDTRERADVRRIIAQKEGNKWLTEQGQHHGFLVKELVSDDYTTIPLLRKNNSADATLGLLDMKGVLEITNPEDFLKKLVAGFGRAKAFGCGLMLIRRA